MTAESLHSIDDLVGAGFVSPDERDTLDRVASRYAVALTPTVRGLIDASDPADPIALQYVPTAAELVETGDERADPIGDHAHSPVEGLVHR